MVSGQKALLSLRWGRISGFANLWSACFRATRRLESGSFGSLRISNLPADPKDGAQKLLRLGAWYGSGSKIATQNGTLVSGNMDQNLRSPASLILTHTHTWKLSLVAVSLRIGLDVRDGLR